jgi:hypothetical protein
MFDEWYAQPSFADPVPAASPWKQASKPTHERVRTCRRRSLNALERINCASSRRAEETRAQNGHSRLRKANNNTAEIDD